MHFDHKKFHSALSSRHIKIKPKAANIAGLQLADVLAYPVKQAILVGKGSVPYPGDVFGKRMYEAARSKFNCHEWTGQIEGYDFKCL